MLDFFQTSTVVANLVAKHDSLRETKAFKISMAIELLGYNGCRSGAGIIPSGSTTHRFSPSFAQQKHAHELLRLSRTGNHLVVRSAPSEDCVFVQHHERIPFGEQSGQMQLTAISNLV